MRRFLARIGDGGGLIVPFLNPNSISWQLKLDVRSITGIANGGSVATWPDSSGNSRDAVHYDAVTNPIYRTLSSPTGQSLVDFGSGAHGLQGAFPATPIPNALGVSIYSYVYEDVVDANDGGGFNAQSVIGCYVGTNWRLYSVIYPSANSPQVGGRSSGAGDQGSGTAAVVKTQGQSLAIACYPPSGALGVVRVYRDTADIGGWLNWDAAIQDSYELSGNIGANIPFKGRMAFVGMTSFALTHLQVWGLHNYFKGIFG